MSRLFNFLPYCLLLFSALVFNSCDKEKEQIPSYLHILPFQVNANIPVTGLGTQDISAVKIFVNGYEIGVFELPCTVPVLEDGSSTVELFPHIKENGIGANQQYYIPYEGYKETVQLVKTEIDTIQPITQYRSNTNFVWMEDFEDQASSLLESGKDNSPDSLVIIPTSTPGVDQPFNGSQYCAYIQLNPNTDDNIFERSSLNYYSIPTLGADVYIELDIKSNQAMQVGIYANDGMNIIQTPVMVCNSTKGEWRKIYVNLKPETGDLPSGSTTRIFFGLFKAEDVTEPQYMYLDNIKLLYLP